MKFHQMKALVLSTVLCSPLLSQAALLKVTLKVPSSHATTEITGTGTVTSYEVDGSTLRIISQYNPSSTNAATIACEASGLSALAISEVQKSLTSSSSSIVINCSQTLDSSSNVTIPSSINNLKVSVDGASAGMSPGSFVIQNFLSTTPSAPNSGYTTIEVKVNTK